MIDLVLFLKNIFTLSKVKVYSGNKLIQNGKILNSYLRVKGKNNHIYIGTNSRLENSKIKIKGKNNKIIINNECYIKGMNFETTAENIFFIIGENTSIQSIKIIMGEGKIEIGKNCMISLDVEMRNTDSHKIFKDNIIINKNKDIKIGDNVWIGTKVIVLKGAEVGNGSIIGAGSIVTGKFEENIILGGNPAHKIKEGIRWEV